MQSGRGTLPISLCMASMPAHVECKPRAGTFDSLTWAPAPCLACEMVPFFPNKNALHPCTLIVCACIPVAYMCCDVLHLSCTQWQAAIYFNNNIRNLQNSFNDDLSLRALATSLAAFLLPIFRWPCSKVCAMSAHILGRKLAPKYGTTNFAPDTQFSFRGPFLGLIVGSVLGSAKSYKKASRNPQGWQRRVEVYGATRFHSPPAGYRNFSPVYIIAAATVRKGIFGWRANLKRPAWEETVAYFRPHCIYKYTNMLSFLVVPFCLGTRKKQNTKPQLEDKDWRDITICHRIFFWVRSVARRLV